MDLDDAILEEKKANAELLQAQARKLNAEAEEIEKRNNPLVEGDGASGD